ncbi:MAG TPA: hypothetical protein VG649_02710 [Candidatus Angelobacter sp.]|nr:hypothetical protein [Candidatus Angelobacter sp.]
MQPGALLDGGKSKNPSDLPGGILIRPGSERLVSLFASLGADSPAGLAPHPDVQQRIDFYEQFLLAIHLDIVEVRDSPETPWMNRVGASPS